MSTPRLHPDTIAAIKDRADIYEVVSEHVVLKKQGKDFVGLCPFHDDKRKPSFSVSPSKQFYYCFSCGAGGNAIKFLMEIGKRSFGDVVLDLANKYQVPIKTLDAAESQEYQRKVSTTEQLYEILALTTKFYEHALRQPAGKAALDYVTQERKFTPEILQIFQIGYAPGGWATLYSYLVEQKNYPVSLVEQAGLIVKRKEGNGYYDRFRDRLIIPILDVQARVIGFGGRALGDEQPKYLNSPETELFDKGKTLYGLDKAKTAIARENGAVVVEGYFDVIALHAVGINIAVASLGTALSEYQVKMLARYTEARRIVFNFDADRAGLQATERAIGEVSEMAYRGDVQLRILNIPDGKDPDEFLKNNSADAYEQLIQDAPLWIDWQIQQAILKRDLTKPEQSQAATEQIVKLLGNLPNPTLRTYYIQKCAELLGQANPSFTRQIEESLRLQVKGQRWHGRSNKWLTPGDRSLLEICEEQLLRIYIHAPQHRETILETIEEHDIGFDHPPTRFLFQLAREIQREYPTHLEFESADAPDLLSILRDRSAEFPPEMSRVCRYLELDETTSINIERAALIVRSAAATLEKIGCEKRARHFKDLWEKTDITANAELSEHYHKQMQSEKKRIQALDRQRQVQFNDLTDTPLT